MSVIQVVCCHLFQLLALFVADRAAKDLPYLVKTLDELVNVVFIVVERNVEMVNENGDIYFSYLRWGKYGGHANHGRPAGDIIYDLDRPTYKIEISRDRTKLLVGQITLMNSASRTFTAKRYLFPIAQGFLDTREAYGLDHNQNAGW